MNSNPGSSAIQAGWASDQRPPTVQPPIMAKPTGQQRVYQHAPPHKATVRHLSHEHSINDLHKRWQQACRSGQRSPKSKHDPSMDLEHTSNEPPCPDPIDDPRCKLWPTDPAVPWCSIHSQQPALTQIGVRRHHRSTGQLAVPTKATFVLAPAPFFFNQASVVGQQQSLDVSQQCLPAKVDLMIPRSGRDRLMLETTRKGQRPTNGQWQILDQQGAVTIPIG
ncbi:hypothetical protein ACLOJK_027271 [Asimina triloba]